MISVNNILIIKHAGKCELIIGKDLSQANISLWFLPVQMIFTG